MTRKDVLPEKYLSEKAATFKRLEFLHLGKDLNPQTDIGKRQHQGLYKIYKFDEAIDKNNKKPELKNYSKSHLICDANHSFYKYRRDEKKKKNR